jgi:hypothetical protein
MNKARMVFESLMRAKGYEDFSQSETGKYLVAALQIRWNYFLLGWEMRGVK